MAGPAIQVKTWPLVATDPDGWKYTGPPADVTAPTVPVMAALFNIQSTSLQAKLGTASTDSQSGVKEYVFSIAPVSTGVFVDQTPVLPAAAITGITFTGLDPATAYQVKVKARDNAGNTSIFSAVANGTTSALAANTSFFPNWPVMASAYVIGDITKNYGDTTARVWTGEKDIIITAWFYPTSARVTTRNTGWQFLRANYPGCKHFLYIENNECLKTVASPGNDAKELTKALIDSGTTGNSNWYLRRASNNAQVESLFSPSTMWELNPGVLVAGLNSLGQRFDEAWAELMYNSYNTGVCASVYTNYYDGIYIDNYEARCPDVFVNNGANSVPKTDIDYNGNGIADVVNKYDGTSTAGGTFQANGQLQTKASIEAKFNCIMIPNAARWPYDYFDGQNLKPPLPLSSHPFYGKWEVILRESANLDFGITRAATATGFSYGGVDPFGTALPRMAMHQKFLVPDSSSRAGKSVVLLEAYSPSRSSNAFTQDDYAFSRFMLGIALLHENFAHCISSNKNVPMPLDELILDIGTPIGSRSMGTLNETTLAWSTRPADFTNGVAKFYWARFTKGIAVVRLDVPTSGVYPSADAALSCTLPAAGTGKKWQMANSATYTSPAIFKGAGGGLVTRTMRNQTPSLNSGADVTTVSLKPYHAAIIRLVNGP
jgi:hypothetical protein